MFESPLNHLGLNRQGPGPELRTSVLLQNFGSDLVVLNHDPQFGSSASLPALVQEAELSVLVYSPFHTFKLGASIAEHIQTRRGRTKAHFEVGGWGCFARAAVEGESAEKALDG